MQVLVKNSAPDSVVEVESKQNRSRLCPGDAGGGDAAGSARSRFPALMVAPDASGSVRPASLPSVAREDCGEDWEEESGAAVGRGPALHFGRAGAGLVEERTCFRRGCHSRRWVARGT